MLNIFPFQSLSLGYQCRMKGTEALQGNDWQWLESSFTLHMLSLRSGGFPWQASCVFQLGSETHVKLKECGSGKYKASSVKTGVRWKPPSFLYLEIRVYALPAAVSNYIIWGKKWLNGFQLACGGTVLLNSQGTNGSSSKISFTSERPARNLQYVLTMYSHMLPKVSAPPLPTKNCCWKVSVCLWSRDISNVCCCCCCSSVLSPFSHLWLMNFRTTLVALGFFPFWKASFQFPLWPAIP